MQNNLKNWKLEIIATFMLAWPIILSNLSNMLIGVTDVLLLGRLGKDELAASAIGVGFVITPLVFGIGIIQASSAIIAQELGARAHSVRMVRRTVRASFWIAFLYSLPVMILLWFSGDLARMAGLNEKLSHDIGVFVRGLEFKLFPALIIIALRNFVVALHRPKWSMIISIFGVFANAFINSGLILGYWGFPKLGLMGAGIGSAIEAFISLFLFVLVILYDKKFRRYHLFGRFWRWDFTQLKQLFRLGLPIGMQIGFEVSVFSAAVFLMGYINTQSAAAHSIAIQIASLTFMVPMGIAQAATVRVGNAAGRKDNIAIGRAGWAAFYMGTGFMALMALLIYFFPRPLVLLFIANDLPDAEAVILIAIGFLKIAAIFQIADGAQVVGAGMLRGLHDNKWPMIFAFIGYWGIGIGLGAYLAFFAGFAGQGIWIGLAAGLGIVAILMVTRFANREKFALC
jgi:multidrug resistance protein, MATE family